MSFSALDSTLSGPLFVPHSMAEIWSDRSRLAAMLKVEWALAMAQTKNGLCPPGVAEAVAAVSPMDFDSFHQCPSQKAAARIRALSAQRGHHTGCDGYGPDDAGPAIDG